MGHKLRYKDAVNRSLRQTPEKVLKRQPFVYAKEVRKLPPWLLFRKNRVWMSVRAVFAHVPRVKRIFEL